MPKLNNNLDYIIEALFFCLLLSCLTGCGGGGGGSGEAGSKASLHVLNATESVLNMSVNVDQQPVFTGITVGQVSEYQSVSSGSLLIEAFDSQNSDKKTELFNEFKTAIPYSLFIYENQGQLKSIITPNDRSDTPQGQIRIRAVNLSNDIDSLDLRFIPANQNQQIRQDISEQTTLEEVTESDIIDSPAEDPEVPVNQEDDKPVEDEIENQSTVSITSGLTSGLISGYALLDSGDYRIEVRNSNQLIFTSEPITYNPNQIESIVISDIAPIIRLNDKP